MWPAPMAHSYRMGLVTNPGRDGYFVASELKDPDSLAPRRRFVIVVVHIYSAPNFSKAWSVQCCLWYCAL